MKEIEKTMKRREPLPAMGHSTIRGGGTTAADVATSFSVRCLGAIRARESSGRSRAKEKKRDVLSLRNAKIKREYDFSDIALGLL